MPSFSFGTLGGLFDEPETAPRSISRYSFSFDTNEPLKTFSTLGAPPAPRRSILDELDALAPKMPFSPPSALPTSTTRPRRKKRITEPDDEEEPGGLPDLRSQIQSALQDSGDQGDLRSQIESALGEPAKSRAAEPFKFGPATGPLSPPRTGAPSRAQLIAPEVTQLTAPQEQQFQAWARSAGIKDLDQPGSHYDYRGYWKDVASQGKDERKKYPDGLHFPDTYKQHGHPTFSIESKYSKGPTDGGQWQGEKFIPAPTGPWKPGAQEAAALTARAATLDQEYTKLKTEFDKREKVVGPALRAHNKEIDAVNAEQASIEKDSQTLDKHIQTWIKAGRPESLFKSLQQEENELNARITANNARGAAAKASAPDLRERNALVQRLTALGGQINQTRAQARASAATQQQGKGPTLDTGPEAVLDKWSYHGKPLNPGVLDTLKKTVKSLPKVYRDSLESGGLGLAAMDTIVEGVEALSGTAAAVTSAIGESLPWATDLPGHKGEPETLRGRLREHIINVVEGHGGKNMPLGVVGALFNPPDSSEPVSYANYANLEQRAKLHVRTPNEVKALETTRRVADTLSRLVQDPVAVGSVAVPGVGGEVLASAFTAKGIQNAYQVATNPNATDVDVAEAFLNAAAQAIPMAVRHRGALGEAVEAGVDVAGKAAYPVGKAMRESILALKLNFPEFSRNIAEAGRAGVHAPIQKLENPQFFDQIVGIPQVGETVGDIYRTVRAPEPPALNENVPTTMTPNVIGGLRLRGFNDADIAQISPEMAHYVFKNDIRKGPPVAPDGTPIPPRPSSEALPGMSGRGREPLSSRPLPWNPPPPARDENNEPVIARGPDAPAIVAQQLSAAGLPDEVTQPFMERAQQSADRAGAPIAVVSGQLGPQIVPAENVAQLAEGTQVLGVIDPHPQAPVRNAMVEAGIPAEQAQQVIDRVQGAANNAGAPIAIVNGQLGIQAVPQESVPHLAEGTQILGVVNPEPGGAPAEAEAMPEAAAAPAPTPAPAPAAPAAPAPIAPPIAAAPVEAPAVTPAAPPVEAPVPAPAPAPVATPTAPPPSAPAAPRPTRVTAEELAAAIAQLAAEEDAAAAGQPTAPPSAPTAQPTEAAAPETPTAAPTGVPQWRVPQTAVRHNPFTGGRAVSDPAAALNRTLRDQSNRLKAIEQLQGWIAAPKNAKRKNMLAKWKEQVANIQSEYENDWKLVDQHVTGVDVPALRKQIEAGELPSFEEMTLAERKGEPGGRQRRNQSGTYALEDVLSPVAQRALDAMFNDYTAGRQLRHVREAMEIYGKLVDDGSPDARKLARALRDATEKYFTDTGPASDVSEAAFEGLKHLTGEEDPDWNNELLENQVIPDAREQGRLIFETLDPKTGAFDIAEFNTAFGTIEFQSDPRDAFPEPETTVDANKTAGPVISQKDADAIVESWKAAAKAAGEQQDNSNRVIISLFDVTGNISQPWREAGYTVLQYDIKNKQDLTNFGEWMGEIQEYIDDGGYEIVGILAQPPCTSFANSGAQWWKIQHDIPNESMVSKKYGLWAMKAFDTPLDYANTLVSVVKIAVAQAKPGFYVMENPMGRIAEENNLPKPTLVFDPNVYGDPYTKRTQLWGEFETDLPTAHVEATKGSLIHELRGDIEEEKSQRSATPIGFAYAFFMANHHAAAVDVPEEGDEEPEAPEEPEEPEEPEAPPTPPSRPTAAQPPVSAKAEKPAPAKSYWMNEADIERAVEHFKDDPILGTAALFLAAFKDDVNAHSDGWAYWPAPSKAASKLQTLLYGHMMAGMGAYPKLPPATAADVLATLGPIKAFMTKRGTKAGMTLPELKLPTTKKPPTSQPAQPRVTKEVPRAPETGKQPKSDQPQHQGDGGVGTPAEAGGGRSAVERAPTPEPDTEKVDVAEDAPWLDTEDYAGYRYLMTRKEDSRHWDPDEEYQLLEAAVATIDAHPMLVRTMPTAEIRDHLAGVEMLRDETGKYSLDNLSSDLIGYDTSTDVVDKLEGRLDRELRRREGQQDLFEKPTAEDIAARAKHPDGRLIAQTGDRVYQEVPAQDGSRQFTYGEVYEGKNQEQRVLVTDSTVSGAPEVGKTWKVSSNWIVVGDPVVGGEKPAVAPDVSTWGHAAKMSQGAATEWYANVLKEEGHAIRVRYRDTDQRFGEGWAVGIDRAPGTDGWVLVNFDNGRTGVGINGAKLEPAWSKGQLVTDPARAVTLAEPAKPEAKSQPAAPRPTKAPKAEETKTPEQKAIDEKRARILAEREELKKQIRAELNKTSMNPAANTTLMILVAKLVQNYIEDGILKFREAALQFRKDFETSEKGDQAFELGWALAQHLEAGKPIGEAITLARSEKATRLKIADALKEGYTSTEEKEPDDVSADRPVAGGQESESGTGGRRGGRAAGARGGSRAGTRPGKGTEPGPGEGDRESGTLPGSGEDPGLTPQLYTITDADAIGTGSKRDRVARNLAAIRVAKLLSVEQRLPTPDEQKILVQYVGWGGLSRIFEPWKNVDDEDESDDTKARAESRYWQAQHDELQKLLTRDEFKRARNSTQNAHYTSPVVIKAMWDAVQWLGVKRGSALEPSSGIGHFVGLMPPELRGRLNWALVEKDVLTAYIAKALYPSAYTQLTGFENATLPDDHFVVAIGNVPFGNIPITDHVFQGPAFVRTRIHNYFFGKALDKIAPGGLEAFITSHGTLDAVDETGQRVRQYLASRGDLLGAIRLPFTTFKGNASTEVVTDIIFLRKRMPGESPAHVAPWMESTPVEGLENKKGEKFAHPVNEYFQAHPEMILGKQTATGKMRDANQYNVEPTGDLATQLQEAIRRLPKNAINLKPKGQTLEAFKDSLPEPGTRPFEFVLHEGRLGQVVDGKVTPVELTAADEARIRGMLPIRDALRSLYDLMANPETSNATIEAAQGKLNKVYDAFVKKHGYISEDKNWKPFREDPDFPLLLSLEDYDIERGTAKKTAVFTTRTLRAEQAERSADTPELALQLMLGERGRIDLDRAGELLGVSADAAAEQMAAKGLIIDTPSGWQLPARYLSGNVRVKLAEAEAAAMLDERYTPAVEALKSVIPPDLPSYKINVRLGATWVPVDVVTQFVAHITNTTPSALNWTVTMSPFDAKWNIEGSPRAHVSQFQTPDKSTKDILLAALNDTRPVVKIDVPNADGRGTHKEVSPERTALARAKREELHKAFSEWLFNADPDRREWAVRTYNDRFNALVEPKFDGSYLTFPGLSPYWKAKISENQRNGVARALLFGNMMAAWVVGAGKTLWMHATGMELRRLGLARKPLYVVPNHLISQAPSEFLQHYPNAKLLVATPEDLEKENRKRFTARIASGDWDGIIMPISTFSRLSMSREAEEAYHQEMLDEIEAAIIDAWHAEAQEQASSRARGRDTKKPPSVKQLEAMRDRIKGALDKLAARPKDDMLSFEQLGVDALIVDEAHKFKNLYFHTRQQAAGIPQGNYVQRAMDMYLKVRYLNKQSNYRNVFFATGTPVSNSMAEIYVMQKLLQEQTLEQAGINSFDGWLQQFGHITIQPELSPSATGVANRTRLSNFRNLPDLGQMFRQVADIKTIDDLPEVKAARPPLETGAPEVIAVPATERQLQYLQELDHRAEHLDPKARHIDNMAKIMMDGRMSALDQRLVNQTEKDDPGGKLNVMVTDAADILNKWKKQKGTMIVFMDMGTPGSGIHPPGETKEVWDPNAGARVKRLLTAEERLRGFDLYEDFKQKLVRTKAVKASEVAFIHDIDKLPKGKQDAARKALFRKVREGEIRVLVGSSDKMATGMNVQDRLVALMNADPTIKPSEMEQRMGRILRQGNRFATKGYPEYDPNFKARILNYVTQGVGNAFGMDAVMWQLNETKAKFIADFYKGRLEQRDANLDLDNAVLSAGHFKAIATGNPLIIDQAKAAAEVDRLRLIHAGWEDQLREARWMRGTAADTLGVLTRNLEGYKGLNESVTPRGETITATIKGEELEGPKAIGEKIIDFVKPATTPSEAHPGRVTSYFDPVELGTMRGLKLWLVGDKEGEPIVLTRAPDDPPQRYYGDAQGKHEQIRTLLFAPSMDKESRGGKEWRNPQSVGQAIANGINGITHYIGSLEDETRRYRERVENYDKTLAAGFGQQEEYDQAVARLDEINRQLGIGQDQEDAPIEDEDEGGESGGPEAMAIDTDLSELFGPPTPPPPTPRAPSPVVAAAAAAPLPEAAGLTQSRGRFKLRGLWSSIKVLFYPEGLGPAAVGAGGVIRHENARSFRELKQVEEALRDFGRAVNQLKPEQAIEYWDAAERGRTTGNPEMDAGNELLRRETDKFTRELVRLDRLKAQSVRDNYIGRFWSLTPEKTTDFVRRALGRRPVEGPKSFLKQRTWDFFVDGIRAIQGAQERIKNGTARPGDEQLARMRPATYNWVESQLQKIHEMQRVITIERELRAEEQANRAKKVMDALGKKPPIDEETGEPWVRLGPDGDPAFTIFGPKKMKVREAFDAKLMGMLHDFAVSLGVRHVRKINLGGANRWGFAVGKSDIVTKVGGPEGVLMHEIGHVLDARYGLQDKWVKPIRGKTKKERALTTKIKHELRALADMRAEAGASKGRMSYFRKGSEKIANMVHAFIYMPDQMKEVAPNAYWALHNLAKDTPELNKLLDIQKQGRSLKLATNVAEQEIPGFPVLGHWYAPKAAAAVWSNHLSKGMRGHPAFDNYMSFANASTQILLAFSGFHLMTIAREAITSRLAQSVDALVNRGKPQVGEAIKNAAAGLGAWIPRSAVPLPHENIPDFIDAAFGKRVMEEYNKPGMHPELASVIDSMLAGGFRGTAESEFWTGKEITRLKKDWDDARHAKGARRGWAVSRLAPDAAFSVIESVVSPLMGKYVPYLKTAATYRSVADALKKLPRDASMDEIRAVMTDIVKEMDYRYGQVVYDNHFVRAWIKDIAHMLFLAPGWTFGTLTLLGRGIKQTANVPVRGFRRVFPKISGGTGPVPSGLRWIDKKLGGVGAPPKELVGPSAAYWWGGVAAFMLFNAILTWLNTGERPSLDKEDGWKDFLAFRDGTTDTDGNPNRHVLPGYEMRDVYSWRTHPWDTLGHKLKFLATFLFRLGQNRTYYGNMVYNPEASLGTKAKQIAGGFVGQSWPLTFQNYWEAQRRGAEGVGPIVLNALGITPAKKEFERTPAQNKLAEYLSRRGGTALTPEEVEEGDQRRALREAYRKGDTATAKRIEESGQLSKRQISNAEKAAGETFLERGFKQLTIEQALTVYELATPAERAKIWSMLSAKDRRLGQQGTREQKADIEERFRQAMKLPAAR